MPLPTCDMAVLFGWQKVLPIRIFLGRQFLLKSEKRLAALFLPRQKGGCMNSTEMRLELQKKALVEIYNLTGEMQELLEAAYWGTEDELRGAAARVYALLKRARLAEHEVLTVGDVARACAMREAQE